jgi:Lon-like ATP-dependent protease
MSLKLYGGIRMENSRLDADHAWIRELMNYPLELKGHLDFFESTADIAVASDPIDRVVFQDRAKSAIRKIAQNKGHILMVGRPGTGKSLLADMFKDVLQCSLGEYIRPRYSIVAYPGKDKHHIRIAYETPVNIDLRISRLQKDIQLAAQNVPPFNLEEPIRSARKVKLWLLAAALISAGAGLWFPPAFIAAGLAGIGAIFMFVQENSHRAQEKIQRESLERQPRAVKHLADQVPEVLFDPTKEQQLMARVSEPDARNMKGGFRHDPYQSGNLHTPAHQRAFLGAHATSPIIYIDELKTLIKAGYMSELLEIMQNKAYTLEGGRSTGSGSADRSESPVRADNIIIACCNHDTLAYLQNEGDGAFLSRIEGKGEIIQMESAVPETAHTVAQTAQYVKQEIDNLGTEFERLWGEVIEKEGYEGVRRRCEEIMGRVLPQEYTLKVREFSRDAVMEIVKELRCRAYDGKLSCILRPINGVIKAAEFIAIAENAEQVNPDHVRRALLEHMSLEGALTRDLVVQKKDLKKYIATMTDAVGYVVGLAVINSRSSGQMYGQPLPIHGQIIAGGADLVSAPGKIGDIAKAAAQNVRASIKQAFKKIGAPYVGYEMHVEYIQAHGGVEGDSASVAMDIALISDYIKQPVNQTIGVTGSLTGDIILAVGGVTEKIRAIMEPELGMSGACIPWQNKHDVEPLLINTEVDFILRDDIPGLRIFRGSERSIPFDIFFCKTKFNAYQILMGLDRTEIEARMIARSRSDLEASQRLSGPHAEYDGT